MCVCVCVSARARADDDAAYIGFSESGWVVIQVRGVARVTLYLCTQ